MQANVQAFYDPATQTVSYIVYDQPHGHAAIIDPVLDYDARSGRTSTHSADQLIAFIQAQGLRLTWILETHAHADHLSSAHYLKQQLGGRIAISERICEVQQTFNTLFHLEHAFAAQADQFDHLLKDQEEIQIGQLTGIAHLVPGHTPADMAYQFGNMVFVGDTLFMPDVGTARCDFPGGSTHALYESVQKLLSLPPATRLMMCHDYPPHARAPAWETTVAEQRQHNIHIRDGIDEATFTSMRKARDASLGLPTLMIPSIQINIRAGALPPAESNGQRYLKIPLNLLGQSHA